MIDRNSSNPHVAFSEAELADLMKAAISDKKLIRLRKLRRSSPGPREWREILEFLGSPGRRNQATGANKKFIHEFIGVSSQHWRVYSSILKIPKPLFAKLVKLRSSGGELPKRGNSADRLSLQKLAIIGKHWPALEVQRGKEDSQKHALQLATKAVDERWNAEQVETKFSERKAGKPKPKPDLVCRRFAALAAALTKVAPEDKKEELKETARYYGARKPKNNRNLTQEQLNDLIGQVLKVAEPSSR